MTYISYLLLVVFTILGALGSFFFKKAAASATLNRMVHNRNLYIGGILYALSIVANIAVLQMLPYTVVLPLSAFTYIWSLYLSRRFLQEYVGLYKICGVSCIILGTALIILGT